VNPDSTLKDFFFLNDGSVEKIGNFKN